MASIRSKVAEGFLVIPDAMKVDAQVLHALQIVGVDFEALPVGVDGLVEAPHFVEGQSDVEEPAAVVGVDGDGGAEFFQRFGPAALLEQFLRLFDPSLGVVPIVHGIAA